MSWAADAECVARIISGSAEPAWWTDDEAAPMARGDALRICLTCTVRDACLADALRTEPSGARRSTIRGGTTPSERERLSRTVTFDDLRVALRLWCWSCGAPVAWRSRGRTRALPRWCPKCKEEAT